MSINNFEIQVHINNTFTVFLVCICITVVQSCQTQKERVSRYPFNNVELTTEARVDDLLSRMTLEEKVSQLTIEAQAIERLGIPEYNWWNEALHGVARSGRATVFPQAIGLAAMFDTAQMYKVATVISDEARAKYHEFVRRGKRGIYQGLTFWSPNINIFRDPRWGRGMETYGEDPILTGTMAIAFIKGLQGNDAKYLKTIATSKHYAVHSGPEPARHSFNTGVSETDLRETYLRAFEMTVNEADVQSIMCAYNAFRGQACCGSKPLLQYILRDEWGFNGYVVSDCGAVKDIHTGHKLASTEAEAAAIALKSGTDLNCGQYFHFLKEAYNQGLVTEADIDSALRRLLTAQFRLGMFDPDSIMPYTSYSYQIVDCNKHNRVALEAARKSIVLLKNAKKILPLNRDYKTIAVIGPNADNVDALLGNYNGIPSYPITPLKGIQEEAGRTKILYALGCEYTEGLPMLEPVPKTALYTDSSLKQQGVLYEFFDTSGFTRKPVSRGIHENIDFYWWDKSPHPDLEDDNFAVRWSGVVVPEKTGEYFLGTDGMTHYCMYFEDTLFIEYTSVHHTKKMYHKLYLEANKSYCISIEYHNTIGDACMQLLWAAPHDNLMKEALDAARHADAVILCMGLSPQLEGEEMKIDLEGFYAGDRTHLDLPKSQQMLIKAIYALGKPTILVLLNGSALSVNWEEEHLPAIIEAWYPGQEGGTAIADVLFGKYNPSGRLPVTYYKSVNDLPAFEDYSMQGRTYRFFEGDVLYPFGYGLSYTTFDYTDISIEKPAIKVGENVRVLVKITNTGEVSGEDVVQLYIRDKTSNSKRPIKDLKAYQRVCIAQGGTSIVHFVITPEMLRYWDTSLNAFIQYPGEFEVMIGKSSADYISTSLRVVK